MLLNEHHEVREIRFSVVDLALSIHHVFLQVVGDGFCLAEIFEVLIDRYAHFFANAKEVIDRIPAGEDHCAVLGDVDFVFSEVRGGYPFHFDKVAKVDSQFVLVRELFVGRVPVDFRLGLRDQYILDLHVVNGGRSEIQEREIPVSFDGLCDEPPWCDFRGAKVQQNQT